MPGLRVLLISPPICEPGVPNLAIELLAELARQQGHHADTLHASLLQPTTIRGQLIHGLGAPGCFAPDYFDLAPMDVVDELVEAAFADFKIRYRMAEEERSSLADGFFQGILDAQRCLRSVLESIPRHRYDVIGFSIGFDSQKLPAAAIGKALRGRGERALMVAGGTGTDSVMGPALLEQFAEFDAVIQGEAEDGWCELLARAGAGDSLASVPGCIYREGRRLVQVTEAAPGQSFLSTPTPDYSSFIAQRARSPYRDKQLIMLLETSRGCWWGRKHHCTFCGIRSVKEEYRARQPAAAVELICELYDRYQPDLLFCTDPIAPANYLDTALPELAAARQSRGWNIFYETKSNLKRRQVAQLAAAGVTRVQPGIESFVSSTLQLMDKGATGIQQISFLKWALAYGVEATYAIITGMPGETAADLRSMIPLAATLRHLTPPLTINRLGLHRFSPHFDRPDLFGIAEVRPFHTQRVIYRCPDERLMRLCYQLDHRVPRQDEEDYECARGELMAATDQWRAAFQAGASLWMDESLDRVVVGRSSHATDLTIEIVDDPIEKLILGACGDVISLSRLGQLAEEPVEQVSAAAARLVDRGLLFQAKGSVLSLPIPTKVDARSDATTPASAYLPRPSRTVDAREEVSL